MTNEGATLTPAEKEALGPGPTTPPQAKKSASDFEPKSSEGPRKERSPRNVIPGAKRIVCRRCGHFLVEVKSRDFELATVCHRCKTENVFTYQELA